jgi:hypothetical protein
MKIQPWPLATIVGGAFVAAVGAFSLIYISKQDDRSNERLLSSSLDGTLKFDCSRVILQLSGDVKLLELIVLDINDPIATFQEHLMSEYAYKTNPRIIPTDYGMIDKFRITNFGTVPLFNVHVIAQVQFSEQAPRENGVVEQRRIASKEFGFSIPRVNPGGSGAVDIYVWNTTQFLATVLLPKRVELQKLGSNNRETVRLLPPQHGVLVLSPANETKPEQK